MNIAALEAQLIVPRTPSPEPLEERDFDGLNREELKELQRRAKEAKVQIQILLLEVTDHFEDHENACLMLKHEQARDAPVPKERRTARPVAGDTLLELDEDGNVREAPTEGLPAAQHDVVMIDD